VGSEPGRHLGLVTLHYRLYFLALIGWWRPRGRRTSLPGAAMSGGCLACAQPAGATAQLTNWTSLPPGCLLLLLYYSPCLSVAYLFLLVSTLPSLHTFQPPMPPHLHSHSFSCPCCDTAFFHSPCAPVHNAFHSLVFSWPLSSFLPVVCLYLPVQPLPCNTRHTNLNTRMHNTPPSPRTSRTYAQHTATWRRAKSRLSLFPRAAL